MLRRLREFFGRSESDPPGTWPSEPRAAIEAVLAAIAEESVLFAIFSTDSVRNYFVQVTGEARPPLHAEAAGSDVLREEALTDDQIGQLARLGWTPPTAIRPVTLRMGVADINWSREYADWPSGRDRVVSDLLETLQSVYGWRPEQGLTVETG